MNYIYLLKKLFNYETYLKYRHHIKIDKDSKEIYWLFVALDNMMDFLKKDISQDEYFLWVQSNLGHDYEIYLKLIQTQDVSEEIIESTLKTIQERNVARQIAEEALKISEGQSSIEGLRDLISTLDKQQENKSNGKRR
jgi:hypothetical protein